MAQIIPFRGLRPKPELIHRVASPPYDVLSSEEAREKAKGNPQSFLHVTKPEIDLDPSVDPYDPSVYAKGRENLSRLIREGVLFQDQKPCFYVYQLTMGKHTQIGLVAAASVEDYVHDIIKKHEFTRPDKENDRMTHIDSLNAQTGPVFLTYRQDAKIDRFVGKILKRKPVYQFTGDYDVEHTVFVVEDGQEIQEIVNLFETIPNLYVADGHHRSAAASRVREGRMKSNPKHSGKESYNYFLSVIFPDNQMQILDYNRVVKDLNGLSKDGFLKRMEEQFILSPYLPCCGKSRQYHPAKTHNFGMYLDRTWYSLEARTETFDAKDAIKQLDVSILQENCLAPILGIQNPRTDKRIHFIGGIRGLSELERLVDNGSFAVAFALHPTSIRELLAVADSGNVMPPKSTWFEPKLADGVMVHMLD